MEGGPPTSAAKNQRTDGALGPMALDRPRRLGHPPNMGQGAPACSPAPAHPAAPTPPASPAFERSVGATAPPQAARHEAAGAIKPRKRKRMDRTQVPEHGAR